MNVGELVVRIGADAKQLQDALKDSTEGLKNFGKQGQSTAAGSVAAGVTIANAFTAAAKAIGVSMLDAIAHMAELGKTAQQLGVTVQELSRLEHAAKQVGVSVDEMSAGMKILARNLGDRSEVSTAKRMFDALGVSVNISRGQIEDGMIPVMLKLADRFSAMADGPTKTRIAMELLGRSGAELIPVLNLGAEGLQRWFENSDKTGKTLTDVSAKAAREFQLQLGKINGVVADVAKSLAKEFLPAITKIAEGMVASTKEVKENSAAYDALILAMKGVVSVGAIIGGVFSATLEVISGVVKGVVLFAQGKFTEALEAMGKGTLKAEAAMQTAADNINATWGTSGKAAGGWAATVVAATDAVAGTGAKLKVLEKDTAEYTATLVQMGAATKVGLEALISAPTAGFEQKMLALNTALRSGVILWDEWIPKARAAFAQKTNEDLDIYMQKLQGMPALMMGAFNPDVASYAGAMAKIDAVRQADGISEVQMTKMKLALKKQEQDAYLNTASLAASAITSLFPKSKGAAIAAALINTARGVTMALSDAPPPLNFINAGLVAAAGAGQIAAIRSTTVDGGGSVPSVPSAPTAPAPAAAAQSPAGGTLTVQGINAAGIFSGDAVRHLAEQLLAYQADGGKIVFT